MRDRSALSALREDAGRKARGAFFTPQPIAEFLATWAVRDAATKILDPTCGEAVFLLAAGRRLQDLGCEASRLDKQAFGIDIHRPSLDASMRLLEAEGLDAHLIAKDVFAVGPPDEIGCPVPYVDAVVGNPPFVRYQEHTGQARQRATAAALKQGVRLSGLASSWAAVLVHASAFLTPEGRLAMVLPAELLTVHYAEPVRRWLRGRFSGVTLVMFERLQFDGALEKVVLLLAHGSGGCDSFSLVYVEDAADLASLHFGDSVSVTPASEGKWTDLLLPLRQRRLYRQVAAESFVELGTFGSVELGTVTGGNDFFAISEATRREFELCDAHLKPICPPGSRHLRGTNFTSAHWRQLKEAGERVWLLCPDPDDTCTALRRYIEFGEESEVHQAYKCQVRTPWWRPPMVAPPDLFFTYMSHRYPRFVSNSANTSLLNSMHGVRLKRHVPRAVAAALPLLALNSVTMLGAEIHGRAYGGGMLKMEPREATALPLPSPAVLLQAWERLKVERSALDRQLQEGLWTNVAKRIDEVLLHDVMGLGLSDVAELHAAAASLRERRLGQ